MNAHLTRAVALRKEATAILEGGLRALLASYGEVLVHGSYALDLMVWRDLDIYLTVADAQVDSFFQLGRKIAALLGPHRMHFRNEFAGATPELPRGLYWGIYARDWKIDLWALSADEAARLTEYETSVARALTPETREAILAIKTDVYTQSQYKKAFSAKDVYDAVLDAGVRDIAGFAAYVAKTGARIS